MRPHTRAGAQARAHPQIKQLLTPHRLLDRLIRGRAWIGIIAFALIGIVAMQLWIVKLGYGIGRAVEHEGLLRRENSTLSIENAELSSGERVERLAAAKGMVQATPGALRFDAVRPGLDARLAAAALAHSGQAAAAPPAGEPGAPASEAAPAPSEPGAPASEAAPAPSEPAAPSSESTAPAGESTPATGQSEASPGG